MIRKVSKGILAKAQKIKFLFSDCDGVLTDGSVYYSAEGEALKRFSLRDGMGVERLRNLVSVETGIITGEDSAIVLRRAAKLKITEYYPGSKDKLTQVKEILSKKNLSPDQVAYIGDDSNDLEIMGYVGLSACPADAMPFVKDKADVIMETKGGQGAFRDFAELIINSHQK